MGMTLFLFSAIVLVILLTGKAVFAGIGKAVCTFMYGTFGYGSYFLVFLTAYTAERLVFEKKIKLPFKFALAVSLTVFSLFLLIHAISSNDITLSSYGAYIEGCYENAANGYSGYTAGGVLSGILVYPIAKLMTFIGAYVVFSLTTLACGYFLFRTIKGKAVRSESTIRIIKDETEAPVQEVKAQSLEIIQPTPEPQYVQPPMQPPVMEEPVREIPPVQPIENVLVEEPVVQEVDDRRKIIFKDEEYGAESYRKNLIFQEDSYFNHPIHNEGDYLKSFTSDNIGVKNQNTYTDMYQDEILNRPAQSAPSNYVYGSKPVEKLDDYEPMDTYSVHDSQFYSKETEYIDYIKPLSSFESVNKTEEKRDEPIIGVQAPKSEENTEPPVGKSEDIVLTERPFEMPKIERREFLNIDEPKVDLKPQKEENVKSEVEDKEEPKFEIRRREFLNVDEPKIDLQPKKEKSDSTAVKAEETEKEEQKFDIPKIERREFLNTEERNSEENEDVKTSEDIMKFFRDDDKSEENEEDDEYEDERVERFLGKPTRADFFNDDLIDDFDEDEPEEEKAEVKPTLSAKPEPKPVQEKIEEEKPKHVWKKYVPPTLDLLDDHPEYNNVNAGEIEDNKRIIVETLARYKLTSEISNVTVGPAITRYDVMIEDKTKIKQALNYKETIAMALMKDNVSAFLNYSKGALSIEVPNNKRTIIGLKSMLTSQKFINSKPNSLTFALGKNVEGEVICPDITALPHLLVAGTTGSGKSICLSTLLLSLLYKYGPEELRLILVDPKQVEFISFDKLPHLMVNEIIYDVDKAVKALNWAIKEMGRRYELFKEMTQNGKATKDLDEYNRHMENKEDKLPKILIVLDEFGDLMLQAKKEIESKIIKLGQKARAAGIHLILATQRPSVDCITGLIKANLPARVGFKVNSFDDSRTIFDIGGAEKLLGKGDLYFRSSDSPELARIQGCFANSNEVQRVTDFIKANNESYFDDSVSEYINKVEEEQSSNSSSNEEASSEGDSKIDETYIKALNYCVNSKQASVSMIQRRFPIGYIKACRIVDWMEVMNYITPSEGAKPRKVLLSKEDFINLYGDVDD